MNTKITVKKATVVNWFIFRLKGAMQLFEALKAFNETNNDAIAAAVWCDSLIRILQSANKKRHNE